MNYLRSLPKEKLQKVILILLASLIASAAIGMLYVNGQYTVLTEREQKIAELKKKILEQQGQAKTERQEVKAIEEIQAFVQAQRASMVAGDPFSWCVREVTLLAEQHPIRVLSLRPGGRSPHRVKAQYEVFALQLELEGSYDDLGTFVKALENKFAASEIRQLEFQGGDATKTLRRMSLSLALLMQPPTKEEKPDTKPKGKAGPAA